MVVDEMTVFAVSSLAIVFLGANFVLAFFSSSFSMREPRITMSAISTNMIATPVSVPPMTPGTYLSPTVSGKDGEEGGVHDMVRTVPHRLKMK